MMMKNNKKNSFYSEIYHRVELNPMEIYFITLNPKPPLNPICHFYDIWIFGSATLLLHLVTELKF